MPFPEARSAGRCCQTDLLCTTLLEALNEPCSRSEMCTEATWREHHGQLGIYHPSGPLLCTQPFPSSHRSPAPGRDASATRRVHSRSC